MNHKHIAAVVGCFALVACATERNSDSGQDSNALSGSTAGAVTAQAPLVDPPQGVPEGMSPPAEVLNCGEVEEADADGSLVKKPELYYPTAMNAKLAKYQQLRASFGRAAVSSCAEARAFMQSYLPFAEANPDLFNSPLAAGLAELNARPEAEDVAVQPNAPPISNPEVATAAQAIRNGTVTTSHYATVRLNDSLGSSCSGIQVSKFHILTSAHCLPNSPNGWIRTGISRQVCNGTACYLTPSPYSDMWLYMNRYPDYTGNGDYPDDIAVATIYHVYDDGVTLADPAKNDALGMRIWLGSLSVNQAVNIYGYGFSDEAGNGINTLRVGSMNITAVNTGWFWSRVVNQAVCLGDSGGPAVVNSNKAAGIPTQISGTAPCPSVGGYVVWSTIAPKMSWIESIMAYPFGSGYQCSRWSSGSTLYARCW